MASMMQQSLAGIKWSALTQLVAQIAQYGSFVVLARLLSPTDFGTVACATLVVGFVAMLNELGLGAALIQRQDLRPGHLDAAFWSNIAIGTTLWAVLAIAAGPIAAFFHSTATAPLLVWLAVTFPLVALSVVPKSLMERSLRFKELGLLDAAAAIANASLSIALAVEGWGAWSLVFGTLLGYVVQVIALWGRAGWRPGMTCNRKDFNDLFGFGLNVLGTRVVGYFNGNVDYLVIGHVLGPAALGFYSLAYKLVTWPMLKISHVTLRVMYPAFARIQDDDEALRRHYSKVVGTLALIAFPILAGLAVLAPVAVPYIFGAKWSAAVLPTQVLCGAGALKAMVCSVGTVFLSKGRPDLELMTNVVGSVMLTSFVCTGVYWGTAGVAVAVLLANVIGAPWQQSVANRLIGLSMGSYLSELKAPAGAACAGALALAALAWLGDRWPAPALLAAAVPVMALAYVGALSLLGCDWLGLLLAFGGRERKQGKKFAMRRPGFTFPRQAS